MLRTELMKLDNMSIYSVDWNSEDDYVVCGTSKIIYLKPLQVQPNFLPKIAWAKRDELEST